MKKFIFYIYIMCAGFGIAIIGSSCHGAIDKLPTGIVKADFDTAVKPQQDFYDYVNGSWLKNNPIPADMPSWGGFTTLYVDVLQQLRTMLKDVSSQTAQPGTLEQKLGDYYSVQWILPRQPKKVSIHWMKSWQRLMLLKICLHFGVNQQG